MRSRVNAALVFTVVAMIFVAVNLWQYQGEAQGLRRSRSEAIDDLSARLRDNGHVKIDRGTGLADFASIDKSSPGSLSDLSSSATPLEKSFDFLRSYGAAFGVTDPAGQLHLARDERDDLGGNHLTFDQTYRGIPVFGAVIKTHFDRGGELRAVNGNLVPDISLDDTPVIATDVAVKKAIASVTYPKAQTPPQASAAAGTSLCVFRTGFVQGISGTAHLAWKVELNDPNGRTSFVFIDARSGELLDHIQVTTDALDRRIFDGQNTVDFPPPNYPANPFWVEGQPFPTGQPDADTILRTTKQTYDLYNATFLRDSFDNAGARMDMIFNWGYGDAQWNHVVTRYGVGLGIDDIVGHEWTHAYTEHSAGLVYQWQPGAINESLSDIFGETIDILNGEGVDLPGGPRQDGHCTLDWNPTPLLSVSSPSFLAGDYDAAPASFGPPFSPSGLTANIVLIDDGGGPGLPPEQSHTDGCQTPYRNADAVSGNIALIDRTEFGTCTYSEKVKNAQLNGAIAVLVANNAPVGDAPIPMIGLDPTITIPSAAIGYTDGQALRQPRARTVRGTIRSVGAPGDNTRRWLVAEEYFSTGIRDMWNPPCDGNPGKTSDRYYYCNTGDNGGVHENSGVPNHAYALLADGGTYNGYSIQPLGLTKSLHIYSRAMSVYLTPTSDFEDLADALELSATDLVGVNLRSLFVGTPSGEVITLGDVDQVRNASMAVQLREPPQACNFQPLLAKDPPADSCSAPGSEQVTIFSEGFESDPGGLWTVSRDVADENTFIDRDWQWVNTLPDNRAGSGFFAPDLLDNCISPPPGQVGVLHLDSPEIVLPNRLSGGAHVSFEHWVSTEAAYDGAQLMISVNGGPFTLIGSSAFIYNPYNTTLAPVIPGYEIYFNPRAGQAAFSGTDGGSVRGSWGRSIVDLRGYARSGDRIRLRWDLSTDYCYGTNLGWYLDDVRVYACRR